MDFSRRRNVGAGLLLAFLCTPSTQTRAQSLREALAAAYNHAPQLQSALLGAKATAEGIVQAKSAKLPTIGASFGGTQSFTNPFSGGASSLANSQLQAGLTYNQTIFDNFQSDAQIEAARAGAEAAEHRLRQTEQNVLLEVVQAYMAVLSGRELLALRQDNISFFAAQLRSAQDRLAVGESTRIDVAQAQARLAQGQAALRGAESNLQISEATFQRLVGLRPNNLSAGHDYAELIPMSLEAAISEAEISHPAIWVAKAGIRAAQAGSDAASAAGGTRASITGSLGSNWSQNSSGAPASGGLSASLGFQISVPIYSGGRLGSDVRQANLELIQSEVDAMGAHDQVRQAVISAWSGIQSADAQIAAAQSAISASDTVLESVIQQRELGTRTTLDVLDAQADLSTARESLISAGNSKVVATFSLLNSIGRLTAKDLGLPVQVKTATPYIHAVEDVWQDLRTVAE